MGELGGLEYANAAACAVRAHAYAERRRVEERLVQYAVGGGCYNCPVGGNALSHAGQHFGSQRVILYFIFTLRQRPLVLAMPLEAVAWVVIGVFYFEFEQVLIHAFEEV